MAMAAHSSDARLWAMADGMAGIQQHHGLCPLSVASPPKCDKTWGWLQTLTAVYGETLPYSKGNST